MKICREKLYLVALNMCKLVYVVCIRTHKYLVGITIGSLHKLNTLIFASSLFFCVMFVCLWNMYCIILYECDWERNVKSGAFRKMEIYITRDRETYILNRTNSLTHSEKHTHTHKHISRTTHRLAKPVQIMSTMSSASSNILALHIHHFDKWLKRCI